jgi:CRP/FNR family transcriptional regulator, cAMP and macrophage regulator
MSASSWKRRLRAMMGAMGIGRGLSGQAVEQAVRLLGADPQADVRIREAAWIARCVGRGQAVPLSQDDLVALAVSLDARHTERGGVVFTGGRSADGVWIVRQGRLELSVGSGRRRTVVHLVRPGDVDGDIQLLLGKPMPYTARALEDATCLFLAEQDFDRLLATHPAIARRWLSSVAERLAAAQARILGLLGRTLTQQLLTLLLEEATDDVVSLPQRTIAAMLGAQRPSVNKILKDLECDGLITVRYAAIEIMDRPALARRL